MDLADITRFISPINFDSLWQLRALPALEIYIQAIFNKKN